MFIIIGADTVIKAQPLPGIKCSRCGAPALETVIVYDRLKLYLIPLLSAGHAQFIRCNACGFVKDEHGQPAEIKPKPMSKKIRFSLGLLLFVPLTLFIISLLTQFIIERLFHLSHDIYLQTLPFAIFCGLLLGIGIDWLLIYGLNQLKSD